MNATIQIFDYESQEVEFDLGNENVMVNATEMAKIFEKKISHFLSNDATKSFIAACLKSRNSGFLGIEKEADLYTSRQRSGTWMHRILALKFAAWLDPDFEIWVYLTIDKILNTQRKALREQAKIDVELDRLKAAKYQDDADYRQIVDLQEKSKTSKTTRSKVNRNQYLAFRNEHERASGSGGPGGDFAPPGRTQQPQEYLPTILKPKN
jgi:hypothetical protein